MGVTLEEPKQVIKIEIHHLDELGYGPNGEYTRREWRELCVEKLLAGKKAFEEWQKYWMIQVNALQKVSFAYSVVYDDGTQEVFGDDFFKQRYSNDLDYCGLTFETNVNCDGILFFHQTCFSHTRFGEHASFKGARFCRYTSFEDVGFDGSAVFEGTRFGENALFNGARFDGNTWFEGSCFSGAVGFEGARFGENIEKNGYAVFDQITFVETTNFSGAIFGNPDRPDLSMTFHLLKSHLRANLNLVTLLMRRLRYGRSKHSFLVLPTLRTQSLKMSGILNGWFFRKMYPVF